MKIKKEYIILIAVAAAAVVYLALREQGKIQYKIPVLEKISTNSLDRLVVEKEGENLELAKKGKIWYIQPEQHRADRGKVDKMLDSLAEPDLVDLVSEAKSYTPYKLDEATVIKATVYEKGNLVRTLYIGKSSNNYKYTYVRIPDDSRVYTLQGAIRSSFEVKREDLRDKRILFFSPADIKRITLTRGQHKIVLVKSGGDKAEAEWQVAEQKRGRETFDIKKIKEQLQSISLLKSSSFLDQAPQHALLTLELDGVTVHTLTLYEKKEEGYPASSSDSDSPFILSEGAGKEILDLFK